MSSGLVIWFGSGLFCSLKVVGVRVWGSCRCFVAWVLGSSSEYVGTVGTVEVNVQALATNPDAKRSESLE